MQEYDWKFHYRHFKMSELECKCAECKGKSTALKMDTEFMGLLEQARVYAGIPFVIGSGYRCKKYNKRISGVSSSEHCKGLAGDISFKNLKQSFKIVYGLITAGFTRIKIYKYKFKKRGWVHADMSRSKSKPQEWLTIQEV